MAADLNDIALFVQVVRCGSFAEAARQRGLPSNTVSRRIQSLETQLGIRLLQRSTRQLKLTSAGQAFLDRCADAVDCLEQTGRDSTAEQPGGLIRVAAPVSFFRLFPIGWVAEFLAAHPRVRVDFVLTDARADLIAEQIDVAFRVGALEDSSYICRQLLASRRRGLVASPAYLAGRGTPSALADLGRHDCVTPSHPSGRTAWRLVGPGGIEQDVVVSGRFMANTAEARHEAALAGLGIALLASAITRLDVQAGLLVPVLPHYQQREHSLSVLYPSRRNLPAAVAAFIELAVSKLVGAD